MKETFLKNKHNERQKREETTIILHPWSVSKVLLAGVLFLLVAHLITIYLLDSSHSQRLVHFLNGHFNLDSEGSIPAFFSACIMLMASVILFFIYRASTLMSKNSSNKYWLILSCIFLFLSLDEATVIHEELIMTLRERLFNRYQVDDLSGFLRYPWIIPYGLLVLVIGIIFIKFVLSLNRKTKLLFIASGSIYIIGAIGFEMLGGYMIENYGEGNYFIMCTTIEEVLEMCGLVGFIYGLLDYSSRLSLGFIISSKKL